MEKFWSEVSFNSIILLILGLAWAYNLVYSAIQNGKKASEEAKAPFTRIDRSIDDIREKCAIHVRSIDERVDELERRMNEHEADLKDLHTGQRAIGSAMLALVDHERQNGNDDEALKTASNAIRDWLMSK